MPVRLRRHAENDQAISQGKWYHILVIIFTRISFVELQIPIYMESALSFFAKSSYVTSPVIYVAMNGQVRINVFSNWDWNRFQVISGFVDYDS